MGYAGRVIRDIELLKNASKATANTNNARANGVIGNGVADDSKALEDLIARYRVSGGEIEIPPGAYYLAKDVTITSVHSSTDVVPLKIRGSGAKFSGPGRFVLDGVKRLCLEGLDAKATKILVRGGWWMKWDHCNFDQLIIGDVAGTKFKDFYWNKFSDCGFGNITFDQNRTDVNENTWFNCTVRSQKGHGFINDYDYNIALIGNAAGQFGNNVFLNCDTSYARVGTVYIDPAVVSPSGSLTFEKMYFDTDSPKLAGNLTIKTAENYVANKMTTSAPFWIATMAGSSCYNKVKRSEWQNKSPHNLYKDGTFMTGKPGGIMNMSGGQIEYSPTGGVVHGTCKVTNPLAENKLGYFEVHNIPEKGYYTVAVAIKNGQPGKRAISLGLGGCRRGATTIHGGHYQECEIDDLHWEYVVISPETIFEAGDKVMNNFSVPDKLGYSVVFGFVLVVAGRVAELVPNPDYKAYADMLDAAVRTRIDAVITKNNLQQP